MTMLQATAIISAVDRASAVFRRVAVAAQSAAGRYGAATAAVGRFGNGLGGAVGAGAAFGSAIALRGEYEIDKLSRLMQSAGELNDQQREMLNRSAIDASVAAAVQAQDIIRGQRELIQGGLDADTVARTTEMFAKIARTNDISTATAAEDAINVANALGFAMDTVEDKVASLKRAMEFMSTVPNLSTESWEGLRTSLKYAAPVAGALKIPIEELGSALSVLADAGFKGEQGGTALRTILTRAIAPTRQARLEMRAFGISLEDLYKFDYGRLGNMESLRERLLGAGLGQGNSQLDKVLASFRDSTKFRDAYAMSDALQDALLQALNIKKGDAEARGILQKVIGGHIEAATEGFDLETYFRGIKDLPLQAMRHLFGIQRVSQAQKLKEELNKIFELPSGERITKFRRLADEFERLMPGSIERRFGPVSKGFAWQIDRIAASLGALRHSVFSSGVGEDLVRLFDRMSTSIRNMRDTDPDTLRNLTYAVAGFAALGPAGFVLSGVAKSLSTIADVLKNPAMRGLVVGGGIGALLGVDLLEPFMSKTWTPFGEETKTFLGPNAPIRQTAALVAELFGQIASSAREAADAVGGLFDIDPQGSWLVWGLDKINKGLEASIATIDWFRKFAKGEDPGIPGKPGSWFRDQYLKSRDEAIKAWEERRRQEQDGAPRSLLREVDPRFSGPVQVQGEAKVDVESKVKIEIEGAPARVIEQAPGKGSTWMQLDTGKSMPDTGMSYGSWRN